MQSVIAKGAAIPALGFGTYGMTRPDMLRMIPAALSAGFRHIDTAQIYRNEAEVGECIAESAIARSEIFVTTKVWVSNYSKSKFMASVDESLQKLKSDYIDLLLLHWPTDAVSLAEQIDNLNAAAQAGKACHIGVSNFNTNLLLQATRLSRLPLVTNQFEYHPYLNQSLVIESTRSAGMAVTAYCGMAIGRVFTDATLARIAAQHQKSIAQIVLRWLIQQDGVVALSRSVNPKRGAENVAIFDFELDQEEMQAIHGLARSNSRIVDPPGLAPLWDSDGWIDELAAPSGGGSSSRTP
jgi:2,5-diketo-D-gluconate reductase B